MPEKDWTPTTNPEAYTREQIYERLQEQIPSLKRRESTPRVMSELGVDMLLDQLCQIQEGEEQMRLAKEFNKVFGVSYE